MDSITYYETENYGLLSFYGTPTLVYISLPDTDASCSSWLNQLPNLPQGYGYRCSATPTNIDGTGWIPINFSASSLVNLQKLPIDPINKPPYYYTYVVGGSYELTAKLEKDENNGPNSISAKDNGSSNYIYERGTNKNITPIAIEEGSKRGGSLVLYLPFDEGNGTSTIDYSGNNNNGTLYNFNWTATSGWTTGKIGKALVFDGVNDYVWIGKKVIGDGKSFTLEAWIKPSSVPGSFIENFYAGAFYSNRYGYRFSIGSSGLLGFSTVGSAKADNSISSTSTIPTQQWSYVVAVRDLSDNTLAIYINGILDNKITASYSGALDYGGLNIGGYYSPSPPSSSWFSGLIDEVRIYNRALSADEIKVLYQSAQ